MNIWHTNFRNKYRIAYRGEWLYSLGSSTFPLEVDLAGRTLCASTKSLGVLGLMAALRGRWLWELRSSGCWHGKEEPCCTPGAWQGPRREWQRWMLAPFSEEKVSVQVSFWSGSFPLCSYVGMEIHKVLCKNANGRVIFFPFSFLLRKELWLFPECMHVEGSSSIPNAISWQMQKLDNILRPSLCIVFKYIPPNLYIATSLATTWLNEWIDVISNLCLEASSSSVMESKCLSPI